MKKKIEQALRDVVVVSYHSLVLIIVVKKSAFTIRRTILKEGLLNNEQYSYWKTIFVW